MAYGPPTGAGEIVLTVKNVAELAGVSVALVYDWVTSGMLTHYRVGRAGRRGGIRIAEADLEAFLLTLRQGPEPRETNPPAPKKSKRRFKHLSIR